MAHYVVAYAVAPQGEVPHELTDILQASGLNVSVVSERCRTGEDILKLGHDADVLLVGGTRITRQVVENLPRCKAIIFLAHGYDTMDVDAATEHGILVVNVPAVVEEVADHTIMLILACQRKVVRLDMAVRAGEWRRDGRSERMRLPPMRLIRGLTLGLVGFGRIGQAVSRRARALEIHCLAHDPFLDPAIFGQHGVEASDLDGLLSRSDVISLHIPLNATTRHLIGERELRLMRSSAYLINTSRGPVVDEPALSKALREGWIAGAGLDVFETEPIPADSPLLKSDNVILTPHSAGYSDSRPARMTTEAAREVVRVLQGSWPENLVNPKVKARARFRAP